MKVSQSFISCEVHLFCHPKVLGGPNRAWVVQKTLLLSGSKPPFAPSPKNFCEFPFSGPLPEPWGRKITVRYLVAHDDSSGEALPGTF